MRFWCVPQFLLLCWVERPCCHRQYSLDFETENQGVVKIDPGDLHADLTGLIFTTTKEIQNLVLVLIKKVLIGKYFFFSGQKNESKKWILNFCFPEKNCLFRIQNQKSKSWSTFRMTFCRIFEVSVEGLRSIYRV